MIKILDDERYTGTYIMGKREVMEVGSRQMRMKDESQWIKIPDHHPAIISKELFDQVKAQRSRFKCPKKNARVYPLRGKVFCGCCRHAMPRTDNKNHVFQCRHSEPDETAPCHGLTVSEAKLEGVLYEILFKQAQIILNVADLSNTGGLELQLAKQVDSGGQVEACLERKRILYERFVLKEIDTEAFQMQKAELDGELARLKQVYAAVTAETERIRTDKKTKRARTELAREITGVSGLTAGLVDTLIDRVYVSPGNQVEIVWKMKDFCEEGSE